MSNDDETAEMRARAEAYAQVKTNSDTGICAWTWVGVRDLLADFASAEVARALAEERVRVWAGGVMQIAPLASTGMASAGTPVCKAWCGKGTKDGVSPMGDDKWWSFQRGEIVASCSIACRDAGRPVNPAPNLSPGLKSDAEFKADVVAGARAADEPPVCEEWCGTEDSWGSPDRVRRQQDNPNHFCSDDCAESGEPVNPPRPTCDTPGCGREIPIGGEGHPETCPRCLAEEVPPADRAALMADTVDATSPPIGTTPWSSRGMIIVDKSGNRFGVVETPDIASMIVDAVNSFWGRDVEPEVIPPNEAAGNVPNGLPMMCASCGHSSPPGEKHDCARAAAYYRESCRAAGNVPAPATTGPTGAPAGFRVIGRSGPNIEQHDDQWTVWRGNDVVGHSFQVVEGERGYPAWDRGEFDILERTGVGPGPEGAPRIGCGKDISLQSGVEKCGKPGRYSRTVYCETCAPEGAPAAPAVPAPWSGVTCSSCRGLSGRHEVFCSSIAARLISACNQHGALAIARQVAPLIREVTAVEAERDALKARVAELEAEKAAAEEEISRQVSERRDAVKAWTVADGQRASFRADLEAQLAGNAAYRKRFGARDNETMEMFFERLVSERDAAIAEKAAAVLAERERREAWIAWRKKQPGPREFAMFGADKDEREIMRLRMKIDDFERCEEGLLDGEAAPK